MHSCYLGVNNSNVVPEADLTVTHNAVLHTCCLIIILCSHPQLALRKQNKHLIFKYFRLINEFQVSPSSSRISSVGFRDDMVVVSSDFDGNVKFNIWKTGILVRKRCFCCAAACCRDILKLTG